MRHWPDAAHVSPVSRPATRELRAVVMLLSLAIAATPLGAQRSEPRAFVIEAGGASAGSLLGAVAAHHALVATRGACGVEDLRCLLGRLGVIGVASVAGATAGGYGAGRLGGTRPSFGGSLLGAAVGVGAGVAAVKGLDEAGVRGQRMAAITYALAQGLVTAAGSRLLARH